MHANALTTSGPASRFEIETPRLRLREMGAGDIDFVAAMLADPDVTKFYEHRYSRTECEMWIARQVERYRRDGHGLWLAVERTAAVPVGQIGLVMQDIDGVAHAEVGWLLHRPYWGVGYATEAAAAVRDAAFRHWQYDHVVSLIRHDNLRSRRVAERLGFTPGRVVPFRERDHIVYEGWPRDAGAAGQPAADGGRSHG